MVLLLGAFLGCSKSNRSSGGETTSNGPLAASPFIRTYSVDASKGGVLSTEGMVSSDPSFSSASIPILPGALSAPVEIALFEAQSLVTSTSAASVGSTNLTAAGPAVAVIPRQLVSIRGGVSVSLPYKAQTDLAGNKRLVVIAIYPGQSSNQLETFVSSEFDLTRPGILKFSPMRFGAFQVAYSDLDVIKKTVDTTVPINQINNMPVGNPSTDSREQTSNLDEQRKSLDGEMPLMSRNAVLGDNKILVPSSIKAPASDGSNTTNRPRLSMFNSQGSLVTQFGLGGHVVINSPLLTDGFGQVVAIDEVNHRIYLGGSYDGYRKGFLAAINFSGALIDSFGTNGIVTFDSPISQVEVSSGLIYVSFWLGLQRLYLDGSIDPTFKAGATGDNFAIEGGSVFVTSALSNWAPYQRDVQISKLDLISGALQLTKTVFLQTSDETGQIVFAHNGYLYVAARSTISNTQTISQDINIVVKFTRNLEIVQSFGVNGIASQSSGGNCYSMVPLSSDKLFFSCSKTWLMTDSGTTLPSDSLSLTFSNMWISLAHAGRRVIGHSGSVLFLSNNPFWSCQSSFESTSESCFGENSGTLIANKSRVCNLAKTDFQYSSCVSDNTVGKICTPNSMSSVSCLLESSNSTAATKTRSCNADGQGYSYGACIATTCAAGNYLNSQTKTCMPQICEPRSITTEDCKQLIPNSTVATISKQCNDLGSGFNSDTCNLSACASGYVNVNNSCAPQVCSPNSTQVNEDCSGSKPFSAVATRTKNCNSLGTSYIYGACTISSCLSGYANVSNSCEKVGCSPYSGQSMSCTNEIPKSLTASKTGTCNSYGTGVTWNACLASACIPPYVLSSDKKSCSTPTNFTITGPSSLKQTTSSFGGSIGTISWTPSSFAKDGYLVSVATDQTCRVTYWTTISYSTSASVPLVKLPGSVSICVSARKSNSLTFYDGVYDLLAAQNDGMAVIVTMY
jgi:hypothetical protein